MRNWWGAHFWLLVYSAIRVTKVSEPASLIGCCRFIGCAHSCARHCHLVNVQFDLRIVRVSRIVTSTTMTVEMLGLHHGSFGQSFVWQSFKVFDGFILVQSTRITLVFTGKVWTLEFLILLVLIVDQLILRPITWWWCCRHFWINFQIKITRFTK